MTPNELINSYTLPVTKNDRLRVEVRPLSDEVKAINIFARLRTEDGTETVINEQIITPASSAAFARTFPLTRGHLITAAAHAPDQTIEPTDAFVNLYVQRGAVADPASMLPLSSGYVSTSKPVIYPVSPPQAAHDAQPTPRGHGITTPAAGAQLAYLPGDQISERYLAFRFQLVTAVAVANRRVSLKFADAAGIYYQVRSRTDQTASQTREYVCCFGGTCPADDTVNGIFYLPCPTFMYLTSPDISTATENLQAADQLGGAHLLSMRWLAPEL